MPFFRVVSGQRSSYRFIVFVSGRLTAFLVSVSGRPTAPSEFEAMGSNASANDLNFRQRSPNRLAAQSVIGVCFAAV